MDIYVLDNQLRRIEVVDVYESFIWAERFSAFGDFDLRLQASRGNRLLLKEATAIGIKDSHTYQTIKTVDARKDESGKEILELRGTSAVSVLLDRVNRYNISPSSPPLVNVQLQDLPTTLLRTLFDAICRNNTTIPADNIPGLVSGTFLPSGSIPEPTTQIKMLLERESLYDTIKKVCDFYGLGFRLVKKYDTGELYFDIYTGSNRTSYQTANEPVIFSPGLDNLVNTSEFTSIEGVKNVAYVFAKNGSMMVYADGVDPSVSGFDRKVMHVDATNVDLPAGPDLDEAMTQRGKEALAEHRGILAFDGEIAASSKYWYGQDYFLGDLVEKRNSDGVSTVLRVTEQIFASDGQGDRSYPTLSIELTLNPGTWSSWNPGQYWADVDQYWADV